MPEPTPDIAEGDRSMATEEGWVTDRDFLETMHAIGFPVGSELLLGHCDTSIWNGCIFRVVSSSVVELVSIPDADPSLVQGLLYGIPDFKDWRRIVVGWRPAR